MVVTKPGQEPVCYAEVILPQRKVEEKPRQEGEAAKPRRVSTRAKKAEATEEEHGAVSAPKKPAVRKATSARAKASPATTAKKRTPTAKKTTTTAKKTTTRSRASQA